MNSFKKLILKGICIVGLWFGIERLARWWHSEEVLVLVYHNIGRPNDKNDGKKNLSAESFRRQIEFLKRHYSIISLEQLLDRLNYQKQEGAKPDLPRNSVVITFDDGQVGIVKHALPVLLDFKIPTAVFLTTGLVGTHNALPMDRFDKWADKQLPSGKVSVGRFTATSKAELCVLRERVKTMDFSSLHIPLVAAAANERVMNIKEIQSMRRGGVTFYPHGHSHFILSTLPDEKACLEIKKSLEFCRLHGLGTSAFAYPNGKQSDFTNETERILTSLGVLHSFSTVPGYINTRIPQSNPLPRLSLGETEDFTSFRIRLAFGLFV